ncbi:mitochondrial inner membrane i-AAA protease supercomplex subunit Mgr1p [Monosporozyma unispora]|nr:mitochondrial inner membrane i-AAA protease complex subunit [Kazachstania unispora]
MSDKSTTSQDKSKGFNNRPSLGLKIWGPLVPAADNRTGLWTLWTIQTGFGIYALYKFRKLHLTPLTNNAKGVIMNGNYLPPSLNRFTNQSSSQINSKNIKWRKIASLIIGVGLLSQSSLEYCRLRLLPFDPWYDEARLMRDKKFFNDIIKFYYKDDHSLDNIKLVKISDNPQDSTTLDKDDNTVDTHTPHQHQLKNLSSMEWRQSIAIIKAQREQVNPVIKWFGPIDYKPMSFGQYLDAMEYYLSMKEIWQANNMILIRPGLKKDYTTLCQKNQEWRQQIINRSSLLPNINSTENDINQKTETLNSSRIQNRSILIDPVIQSRESIDLNEIWTLHDPWMNLALDTSLSIKFIPTSINSEKKE